VNSYVVTSGLIWMILCFLSAATTVDKRNRTSAGIVFTIVSFIMTMWTIILL
jgi:uncharacterized MnhB-related membrane protein